MSLVRSNSVAFSGNLGIPARYKAPYGNYKRAISYGSMALDLPGAAPGGGVGPLWITLIAYDDLARELRGLALGTFVTVRGALDWPLMYTSAACAGQRMDTRIIVDAIECLGGARVPAAEPLVPTPAASDTTPTLLDEHTEALITSVEQVIASIITTLPTLRPLLTALVARRA